MNIGLALPCYRDVRALMAISLAQMCAYSAAHKISLVFAHCTGIPTAIARNGLVERLINCDKILFVDDDMVFPPETLVRLNNHSKQIIGVRYANRLPPHQIISGPDRPNGLAPREFVGTGVMLVDTSVFRSISPPWFEAAWGVKARTPANVDGLLGEDGFFCHQARQHGIEVWCDSDIKVGHIGEKIT